MKIFAGILLSSIALGSTNLSAAQDIGVGLKMGTVGAGVDLSITITNTLNARVSLSSLPLDSRSESITIGDDFDEATIDATMDVKFGSSALLVDWHVFDGTFHLSTGLINVDVGGGFIGDLSGGSFTSGGETINSADIGVISGSLTLSDSYQPYIGLGWGRKAAADSGPSLSIEVGVALLDPKLDLNATSSGGGSSQAEIDAALSSAESSSSSALTDLSIWPILSIGLNYAF
jgi:hypothetical protein